MKKKVIILITVIVGLYFTMGALNAADSIAYGDVNVDGKINSTDASYAERYVLGSISSLANPKLVDVNGDGKINTTDCSLITRYILGSIDVFPAALITSTNTVTITKTATATPTVTTTKITDLSQLPSLSMNPKVSELKAFVSKTYDMFPQFKSLYESDLGMSKDEAMAFHFADMTRESGKDGYWQIDLETGMGGAGHAWGPFQAAVTNFTGGGYDNDILNRLGMPTPNISQFKVPNVSTYAGMKRLAEGIAESKITIGANRSAVEYLLGTLAHHNTGHATLQIITDQGWLQSYGNETLRLMQGYLVGNHLTDDKAFWTTEPISGVTGTWSGGKK